MQARNGYLLLGTGSGLFRFDGVKFQRFALPSGRLLPSNNITAMIQSSNGDIWLGYFSGGVGLIRAGKLISYSTGEGFPDAMVFNFSESSDGTLWAATTSGLVRFSHGIWKLVGTSWNVAAGLVVTWTLMDRAGNLWVTTDKQLLLLRRGSRRFIDTGIHVKGIPVLAQAPDGMLWLSDQLHGTRALPGVTAESPYPEQLRAFPHTSFAQAKRMLFDRAGHLWVTNANGGGIFEVAHPQAFNDGRSLQPGDLSLVVRQKDGLTSDTAVPLLQDREGTIWVGTNLGLNSFRHNNVEVPTEISVGPSEKFGLCVDSHGTVWIINARTLFRGDHGSLVTVMKGIPDFSLVQAGKKGVLWLSSNDYLSSLLDGKLNPLPEVDGQHLEIRAMAGDRLGGLWVSFRSQGIQRFAAGRWIPLHVDPVLDGSDATSIGAGPGGDVWFGYSGNRLVQKDGTRQRLFTARDGLNVGGITVIDASTAEVLIGGGGGLARFDDGVIRSISSQRVAVLNGISGIVRTANGDVWVNGSQGVVHIRASDLDAAFRNPDSRLQYHLYDYDAGLPGIALQESTINTAVADADGRLWFSTNHGIAWIDPSKLRFNHVPPPVDIQSLTAMGKTWTGSSTIHLPEHTSNVKIDYTALSFAIPGRVDFRYRLQGVDEQWQDAGDRREAFYTNLLPGNYHFQVIAANADGLWNRLGAAIDFTIQPAFYQTTWFLLLCLAAFAAALFMLYLLRLRQMTLRVYERLNERHLERERIARELHDTLLQSVQGLVLRFQAAAEQLAPDSRTRLTLEKALNRSDDVLVEARNRVRDLRAMANDIKSLSRAMAAAGEELTDDQSISFRVITGGARRVLNPVVREEAYRIGREALINALTHAHASLIEVEIHYDPQFLRVRIRDDGVGIEQDLLNAHKKPDHWGLAGMRERAERLGATLEIWGSDGVGTEVALKIPAGIAYCDDKQGYLNWLRRLVSGGRYG